MSGRGPWLALGGVLVFITLVVLLAGPPDAGDSPDHRSTSDGAHGTSALRLYARALGHPSDTLEGTFDLPRTAGLLFVFSPSDVSGPQAQQLTQWVSDGGVLVYAAEEGDPQLDALVGVQRTATPVAGNGSAAGPLLGGVRRVQGGDQVMGLKPGATQVPILRSPEGDVLAVIQALGSGRVVVMADPLPLCNAYLGRADNGRLAADLLALTPAGGQVLFDEYHHGLVAGGESATAWMTTSWGGALLWAVAVLFTGLAIRGRGFGPRIPLAPSVGRSSAEFATAVGRLLRRVGARKQTLEALDAATRREIAQRAGLAVDPFSPAFFEFVSRRSPGVSGQLAAAESALGRGAASEAAFLEVARQLHEVAYPASGSRGRDSA